MIAYENELLTINSNSSKNIYFLLLLLGLFIVDMADIKLKRNSDIKNHIYYYLDDIVTINDLGFIETVFDQKSLENIYCHEYRIIWYKSFVYYFL